jgi:cation:H+ antiporter
MNTETTLLFVLGLVLLVAGGEMLIRGASRLAVAFGISPLVVGLTVVAFGTSSPELAVTASSALQGKPDIGIGNVVGSNICNVLLILGLSAVIAPLAVARRILRLDVPLMIALSFLVYLLGMNGLISRWEGAMLFGGLILYTFWTVVESRRENLNGEEELARPQTRSNLWINILLVIVGLCLLMAGSNWLIGGAVVIARLFGVSELIIGLTVVAIGTSLPEIAASVIASLRGERDIAVGNVIGSNLFNIMSVLGLSSLVSPHGIPVSQAALHFDIPVMIATAVACFPVFLSGFIIRRWEGAIFLGYYVVYTLYLILNASKHDVLPIFSSVMMGFVIPITVLTLLLSLLHARRQLKKRLSSS